jgi:opacity protein-like surface antigen
LTTAFVVPGQRHRPIPPGEGLPTPPRGIGCNCESEARYSLSWFGGVALPHGTFNSIADPSYSFGIKPALHFSAGPGRGSLGLYLGRDNFTNPGAGGDFHLTHVSPELEFAPLARLCPTPSVHIGAGAYRDENGATRFGFNAGLGLSVCLTRRLSFLSRYDYRSVHALSRDYSTIQVGLRFSF